MIEITEVRVSLRNDEKLKAFVSITLNDSFVIRGLKIIRGNNGLFVAMPSRKLTDRCMKCSCKNHLRARFCNSCGARLDESRAMRDVEGRAKLHADIAHPIHSGAREQIQGAVIKAYADEKEKAKMPGYVCTYDDYDYDADDMPVSYGNVVSEMGKGVRAHGGHAAPKGTHFHTDAPAGKTPAGGTDDFAAGIG